jgi:hypothetical protein
MCKKKKTEELKCEEQEDNFGRGKTGCSHGGIGLGNIS